MEYAQAHPPSFKKFLVKCFKTILDNKGVITKNYFFYKFIHYLDINFYYYLLIFFVFFLGIKKENLSVVEAILV